MTEKQEKRHVSKGKCAYCGKEIAKSGIGRHLASCAARTEASETAANKSKAKPVKIYHLKVEGAYAPVYWMHIEMAAGATLRHLDQFLRDIWLECCGHLSMFTINGQNYSIDPMVEYGDRSMNGMLINVLKPGMEFTHEYDFGSTTYLKLKVIGERQGVIKKTDVHIMARNNQPEIMCGMCGKNLATHVCVQCVWEKEGWLCKSCAQKHECGTDMMLPVVNSPRVGECGYTGDADDDWYLRDDDFDVDDIEIDGNGNRG